eukprot:CAMPEP_0202955976 /NCGR_PEP_ID=MMETSP1396-20130829/514_1 /ASSEMBLY_ACC=CAM_ASM_000872 /TAXON_ID= /ORGANISM="Pseudokeronopsis sp., Strain Brazil" /LENGTH=114 /DNA_ID=CAMNT_0049672777 /DNA_START=722 /DNA_END=1066 /DNA_ORIENTATION=-
MEVTLDELCKGHPDEFKEFMNYARELTFTETPDYKWIISLFQNCMKRHNIDLKTPDFIWNTNRTIIEKRRLKEEMQKVLNMKASGPAATGTTATGAAVAGGQKKGIDKSSAAMN